MEHIAEIMGKIRKTRGMDVPLSISLETFLRGDLCFDSSDSSEFIVNNGDKFGMGIFGTVFVDNSDNIFNNPTQRE